MRENVKVKMLQKCIFELIYEQNHTSYILEHQERKEKIWKDTNINIYIYIYINAQLSYFKIPQVNMYMFNWKRARAQLKHTHAQLKAGICTTEACIC